MKIQKNNEIVTFDFLEIVLRGFCDPVEKVRLADYFLNEYKKAKDYGFTLFFKQIWKVTDSFEKEITDKLNKKKEQCHSDIKLFGNNEVVISPEERKVCKDLIKVIKSELRNLNLNQFSVVLNGKFCGLLHYWEIQFIRKSIKRAQFKSKITEPLTFGSFHRFENISPDDEFNSKDYNEEKWKGILEESIQGFIEDFYERATIFTDKYKAEEKDFILIELQYLEKVLYDIKVREVASNGYAIKNFLISDYAADVADEFGFDSFCSLTSDKIDHLRERLKESPSDQFFEQETFEQLANETNVHNDQTNVFCQSMPVNIPIEHFKIFTHAKSKNGKPFLNEDQFNSFIERAFTGNAYVPKQRMNQSKGEKLLIQAVFYDFYYLYCFEYFNTMQCWNKFIRLLTDNFEGWDFDNIRRNFKPKSDKRINLN